MHIFGRRLPHVEWMGENTWCSLIGAHAVINIGEVHLHRDRPFGSYRKRPFSVGGWKRLDHHQQILVESCLHQVVIHIVLFLL